MLTRARSGSTSAMPPPRSSPTSSRASSGSRPNTATNGGPRTSRGTTWWRTWCCSAYGCSAEPDGHSSPAEQALRFLAEFRRDVGTRQRIGHVRGQETDLRDAVVALAVELQSEERLPLGELDH